MRLKKVSISDYKNLKDFELKFDDDNFLEIFVGKNGTGKSNLFEALIEIFRHLDGADDALIDFEYELTYEIGGTTTETVWKNSTLSVNGKAQKTLGNAPRPDNILVYYSGHNETVTSLIKKYESSFRKNLKGADASDNRYFIGIAPDYKELLLTAILLKPENSLCREYVCNRLGIQTVDTDLRITLKRPSYAQGKKAFDITNNDDSDKFWKAEGVVREFLNLLETCQSAAPKDGRIRTEGYQSNRDQYSLYVDCAKLREAFADKESHELFNAFDKLKVLEMLEGLYVQLTLQNGEPAQASYFSDGQFQSVYIYAITELFKAKQCLTLLDEPDSFLHPEWQHEFLDQVFEISDAAAKTNHTLLSSHSASTISSSDDKFISLFEINGSTVKVTKAPKCQVINSLSAGVITFSETEAQLSIQNVLANTTGAVLFTEGITDKMILETAWKKLYPGETRPFEIQNAFGHEFLGKLLRESSLYHDFPNRTFFGLFDFDSAYNTWNGINKATLEADPCKCMTKKHKDMESYALLLPVPSNSTIKNQVINESTGATYKGNSHLTIELLFHDVPGLQTHFAPNNERPDKFKRFVGSKKTFAEKIVPSLNAEHCKAFLPLFKFIKSKCTGLAV